MQERPVGIVHDRGSDVDPKLGGEGGSGQPYRDPRRGPGRTTAHVNMHFVGRIPVNYRGSTSLRDIGRLGHKAKARNAKPTQPKKA